MINDAQKIGESLKDISSIDFYTGSKEELLPDFQQDFPYIASRVALHQYAGGCVPWHWHRPLELFYMESGSLIYSTPKGTMTFPAGSGGMINSNVLHMTRLARQSEKTVQLLHIFDASLIAGDREGRIGQKYVAPILTSPQLELMALFPDNEKDRQLLSRIAAAFRLSEQTSGYELRLREALSEIWLLLYERFCELQKERKGQKGEKRDGGHYKNNDKIKQMMVYVHEHYQEKLSVAELAAAAYLSERECFRIFQECLHTTPADYIRTYRLQIACRMLAGGQMSVTAISHACGLGSSSYFGKVFRGYAHCTPSEYRKRWQNSDI